MITKEKSMVATYRILGNSVQNIDVHMHCT